MPDYLTLKMFHASMAILSGAGFLLRSYWMLSGSALLQARLTKIGPHVVDTLLLLSAILMLMQLKLWPWQLSFVGAKIILLLVYIVSGSVALKRGRNLRQKIAALTVALTSLATIFYLAFSKPVLWS